MSHTHLKSGDALPAKKDGSLRIYSMRFCPWDHRTRLVLSHKGVPHDVVFIHLKQKPEWFTAKNPVGTVPTVELPDGKILWESGIVNEYLDEVYPEKKLNPQDPFEKARQRIIVERWGKVVPLVYKCIREPDQLDQIKADIKTNFKIFEELLTDTYFGGKAPAICDYNMWPAMERIIALSETGFKKLLDDNYGEEFPKIKKWADAMLEQPAVKENYVSAERMVNFIQSHLSGAPNYEL